MNVSDWRPTFTKSKLQSVFAELSVELAKRNIKANLFVVGGAAIALEFDHRRVTLDIDAYFVPAKELREVISAIALRNNFPEDWLNDGVKGFLPGTDPYAKTIFESNSLTIQIPSAKYLLAMKLLSGRFDRDIDDAVLLWQKAGLSTASQGMALLRSMYPKRLLEVKHKYIVEGIAARVAKESEIQPNSASVLAPELPPGAGQANSFGSSPSL